jgi:DNA polymerase III subunit gamma/tau
MGYLVLARKYRPQTFDEVVGQQHVTRTLKNAIKAGRVAHAILFAGPRGTGKTTIARILAKAMNCQSGPTETPCNVCRSCTDITAGRGVDVFEIDGASNNSVEQVRELRENSRYMPAHSRFKIYVIDEVHMLSVAAFNALLKTLEEPPAHVMFLFATTEAHKIPITILSRCQRHDLRRIEPAAISAHMQALCEAEGLPISEATLWTIARESGGSMRDALSLLDQILACSDGQVDDAYVASLLGTMDRQILFDLSAAMFARDMSRILDVVDQVYKSGQDLKRFYADLLMHVRHLMLVKLAVRGDLLADLAPGEIDAMRAQVKDVSSAVIDQAFSLLFNAEASVRHSAQPRLAIEMAFFKIHQIVPVLPIDQLIEGLDALLRDPQLAAAMGTGRGVEGSGPVAPPATVSVPASSSAGAITPATLQGRETDPRTTAGDQVGRGVPAGAPPSAPPADAGNVHEQWQQVLGVIVQAKPSLAGALSRTSLADVRDGRFNVVVSDGGYTMKLISKHLAIIEQHCRDQTGLGITFTIAGDTADVAEVEERRKKADDIKQQMLNHPLVADAVDIFSGSIEEIKLR